MPAIRGTAVFGCRWVDSGLRYHLCAPGMLCMLLIERSPIASRCVLQDKVDDASLGLRSTALWMGDSSRDILSGLAVAVAAAWAAAGALAGLAPLPYYSAVAAALAQMLWQVRTADYSSAASLGPRFEAAKWVALTMFIGVMLGRRFGESADEDEVEEEW